MPSKCFIEVEALIRSSAAGSQQASSTAQTFEKQIAYNSQVSSRNYQFGLASGRSSSMPGTLSIAKISTR